MPILLLNNTKTALHDFQDRSIWAEIAPKSVAQVSEWADLDAWLPAAAKRGTSRIVFHAGNVPETSVAADAPDVADQIETAWRSWSSAGHELLAESIRAIDAAAASHNLEPLIWPRLHSLVSDIPGLLSLTRRWERQRIFLDPAALLADLNPSHAADFLARMQTVIALPGIAAILFTNLEGGSIESGPLDPKLFVPLARAAADANLPIVLLQDSPERQLAALGLSESARPI